MDERTKEVNFVEYCVKCKHWKENATDEPCNECITQGWNIDSHKPIKFEGEFLIMDIYEGQRFYRNTKDVANGANLPDYLIIKKIIRHRDGSLWLIRAEYENHHVGERYKMFNVEILLSSNLNPLLKGTPLYIFKEGLAADGQTR